MHNVPVVLNGEGVFTFKVFCKALDTNPSCFDMPPGAGFTESRNARVGADAGKHELSDM